MLAIMSNNWCFFLCSWVTPTLAWHPLQYLSPWQLTMIIGYNILQIVLETGLKIGLRLPYDTFTGYCFRLFNIISNSTWFQSDYNKCNTIHYNRYHFSCEIRRSHLIFHSIHLLFRIVFNPGIPFGDGYKWCHAYFNIFDPASLSNTF